MIKVTELYFDPVTDSLIIPQQPTDQLENVPCVTISLKRFTAFAEEDVDISYINYQTIPKVKFNKVN